MMLALLQLKVSTTLSGLTSAGFSASARDTSRAEVASLFSPQKAARDVDILSVTDTPVRRVLLPQAILVDYVVGGLRRPATFKVQVAVAATTIGEERSQTRLFARLRLNPELSALSSVDSRAVPAPGLPVPCTSPAPTRLRTPEGAGASVPLWGIIAVGGALAGIGLLAVWGGAACLWRVRKQGRARSACHWQPRPEPRKLRQCTSWLGDRWPASGNRFLPC
eukprot:265218-Rhodomonas_salina.3